MACSLFVGIDVSRKSNVVCGWDDQGQQVSKRVSFPTSLPGTEQREQGILQQMQKAGAQQLGVGSEATSF